MSEMTEKEAKQAIVALGTAMMNNDKEARESIYADFTNDELKKVVRWAMRQLLYQTSFMAAVNDIPLETAWFTIALAVESEPEQETD